MKIKDEYLKYDLWISEYEIEYYDLIEYRWFNQLYNNINLNNRINKLNYYIKTTKIILWLYEKYI